MSRFIKRILFFLGFLTCFFGIIYAFNEFLFNSILCTTPPNKPNLLLGHSHVRVTLDPSLIKNSIHATIGAQPCFLSYIKLKYLLKHNSHINTVVLGFSPHDFSEYQDTKLIKEKKAVHFFDKFIPILAVSDLKLATFNRSIFISRWLRNRLLLNPFYTDLCKRVWNIKPIRPRDFPFFGKFSSYKEERLSILLKRRNIKKYPDKVGGVVERQYHPRGIPYGVSQTQTESFKRIIELCQSYGIMLYLYTPPLYHRYRMHIPQLFKDNFNSLKAQYENFDHIEIINLSALDLDATYFWDDEHINIKALPISSQIVNEIINKGVKSGFTDDFDDGEMRR